jgi:ribonuclease J
VNKYEIIPLGGCGEIGKNMTVVKCDEGMIVIDCGLSFPHEEMHGVDIVIPDFTFLKENRDELKGIILTHAHEDHVGALSYVLRELDVPVYGSDLTLALVRRKLSEKLPVRSLDLQLFPEEKRFNVGPFEIEPIHITHSMPDTFAIAIHTAIGMILFSGDFKFDFSPIDGKLTDLSRFGTLGDEGVLILLSDSTNSEFPGWCPSESSILPQLDNVFREATGRILITMFASSLHRIQQAFNMAEKHGKKVAIAGRSMDQNIATAKDIGWLKIPRNTAIPLSGCDEYDDDKIVILATGSQGEPLSALNLMSKEEYTRMQIREGDTVIYSARPIPGNESAIWQTVNRLFRQGARVLYGFESGLHASGHGYQEELKLLINLTRPQYVAPVHGEPRHQYHYSLLAKSMGYTDENIIMLSNGNRLVLEKDGAYFAGDVVCGRILVDSSGVAGVTDEVLRDRQNLANDGVVLINVVLDSDAGKVVLPTDVVARGVQFTDGEISSLQKVLSDRLSQLDRSELKDRHIIHQEVTEFARSYLKTSTNKRPLVIASIVDI